ncbi:MAG: histidinol-phosphate transaminase [Bacteroidales bacterium]|nr:histidinol-phosphate transaminase [Bacteroidales bacterium]
MIKIEDIVRPNILNLQPYSSAREEYTGKEGVFLDANENPYGELNRYPDPYQKALKQKIAALKNVDSKNIFVGNGSDEIIDLTYRIFCNPGVDKALTFTPTYGMYEVSAGIHNIALLKITLADTFQIDLEQLKPLLKENRVKLIFICSPNNPTGNLMNNSDIEFILKNFNGIVFIDEAYIDFAKEESLIRLISQYNNLIVSQTFSKAWGLAAARVGLAFANEEIIALFNKVKPPYNVSQLNQNAALNALNKPQIYKENIKTILKEKERLLAALTQIKRIKKIYPSDANFLLLEVENADFIYNELVAQQIIIRNRNKQVDNCIRVTIGTPEENNKLIMALKNLR